MFLKKIYWSVIIATLAFSTVANADVKAKVGDFKAEQDKAKRSVISNFIDILNNSAERAKDKPRLPYFTKYGESIDTFGKAIDASTKKTFSFKGKEFKVFDNDDELENAIKLSIALYGTSSKFEQIGLSTEQIEALEEDLIAEAEKHLISYYRAKKIVVGAATVATFLRLLMIRAMAPAPSMMSSVIITHVIPYSIIFGTTFAAYKLTNHVLFSWLSDTMDEFNLKPSSPLEYISIHADDSDLTIID